jgi:hypothetical protein
VDMAAASQGRQPLCLLFTAILLAGATINPVSHSLFASQAGGRARAVPAM